MNVLAITYAFMIAFCPYDHIGFNNALEKYSNTTHTEFELGFELFECVSFKAGEKTCQTPNNSLFSWCPYTQSYWVSAEFEKSFNKSFSVNTGVKHQCQHPVTCWQETPSGFNRAFTEIYVKIHGKVGVL